MKKKIVSSNIQINHTLGEYQRYFSHLLAKGKLKRYKLSEKNKLNPKRQYWKITDEKGETYYYELPKYLKPGYTKSAYSMKRVMHRRPARIALAIFAGTAIISFTSAIVTKKVFSPVFPDDPSGPTDLKELEEKLDKFLNWQAEHEGEDITKSDEFTIAELGQIGIARALLEKKPASNDGTFKRRNVLGVGYGHTTTHAILLVDVDISNAFIYQNGNALEESISYSKSSLPGVPKVGRRDFYTREDDQVRSNPGVASAKTTIEWDKKDDKEPIKSEDYIKNVGKIPDIPFLYTVNEETVLSNSSASKIDNGYVINLNLDTVLSVAGYVKRIAYLSEKSVTRFYSVKLTLITDENFNLLTTEVNENYDVDGLLYTEGSLKTTFYYDNVPAIPKKDVSFDYSKYPPKF